MKLISSAKLFLVFIPLLIIPSSIILWKYLYDIGRLDLFTLSINNSANLLSILILFVALFTLLAFLLVAPGFLLAIGVNQLGSKSLEKINKPVHIITISVITLILNITSITYMALKTQNGTQLLIVFFIIMFFSFILTCGLIKRKEYNFCYKKENKIQWDMFKTRGSILYFTTISNLMFLGFTYTLLLSFSKGNTPFSIFHSIIYFIIIACSSYIPGLYFIYKKINSKNVKLKSFIYLTLTTPLVLSLLMPNVISVFCDRAMKLSGISDWSAHYYAIDEKHYPPKLFPETVWGTTTKGDIPNTFFITATKPLKLGSNTLLCPTTLLDIRSSALKFDFDYIDSYKKDYIINLLKEMSKSCFIFDSSSIEQTDTTFSNTLSSK